MSGEFQNRFAGQELFFDKHPRVLGIVFLVIGLICGLVAFYFPIHDAPHGGSKITFYSKAVYGFIIFTILGFTILILGPVAVRIAYKYASLRGWGKALVIGVVFILFILLGELVQQFFEQFIGKFGYKF